MTLKKILCLTALPFCLATNGLAAANSAKSIKVNGCEIAFTPGNGALNAILTQLNAATNTVDVAMFRLSNKELVDALCILERERKVTVRVIMDAQEIDPAGEDAHFDKLRQQLLRNGVQVLVYSDQNKNGWNRQMHLRCAVVDGKTVLTGSCNWRAQSFKSKVDDVLVLHSPILAKAYTKEINSLLKFTASLPYTGAQLQSPDTSVFPAMHVSENGSIPGALVITNSFNVSVYFSPEASGFDVLARQIRSATNRVDMAMRYLGYDKVNKAVTHMATNGVSVRLAVDKDMLQEKFKDYHQTLTSPGITAYASKPKEAGLHLKVTSIDNRWLWTGSANATVWADTLCIEDMLQIDSPEVTAAYREVFDRLSQWFDANPEPGR